ncbi:MAG: energy transducer TonB [Sulfuritalea sp.]|nr:energy transducer TonB [Sulfuritalea sp.]
MWLGLSVKLALREQSKPVLEIPPVAALSEASKALPSSSRGKAEIPGIRSTAPAPHGPQGDSTSSTQRSSAGPSGIVSGPWYYPASYLHRKPTPLRPILPSYPRFVSEIAGRVVILLLINPQGSVDTFKLMEAKPAGVFDQAVISAFVNERFAPGLILRHPVRSQLLIEVIFEPGSRPQTSVLSDSPR